MKEFIKGNKESITIIFVSIIAFIVGCFGIGFIKSFLIIGLLDAIVFLYPVLVNKFKGKEKPTMEHIKKEVQNKINNELIKKKQPKEKILIKEKNNKNNYNSSFITFYCRYCFIWNILGICCS